MSEVKLLLDDLEMKNVSDDSLDFEVNNFVVNLPLDGDTLELPINRSRPGCMTSSISKLTSDVVDDPDLNVGTNRYSIVVEVPTTVKTLSSGPAGNMRRSSDLILPSRLPTVPHQ